MGIFTSKPKPTPTISVEGVEVIYDIKNEWWEFTYAGKEFISYEPKLIPPSQKELNEIISTLSDLHTEMAERISNYLKEWNEVKVNDGETCMINIERYGKEKSFDVTWSGGTSWGDMGVDFTIRNGRIEHETWGD